MRFSMDPAALRASAGSVEEALARLGRVQIGVDLAPVATALPGGRTAAAVPVIGTLWDEQVRDARWALRDLGAGLAAAAATYASVEASARQSLTNVGRT